jgi:hypothetical protein
MLRISPEAWSRADLPIPKGIVVSQAVRWEIWLGEVHAAAE